MAFPTTPDDGDEYTNALGTKYKYQAADHKWYIISITAGDLLHNELDGLNAGDVYEHISQDQKNALHAEAHDLASHTTKAHQELTDYNAEANVKHLTDAQVSALHTIYTLEVHNNTKHDPNYSAEGHDHVEADITDLDHLTEGEISLANLLEKNHASLTNKNTEANVKHLTDAQLADSHAKQHAMDDAAEHTSSDISTLNASTTKHGFLKKLDNNATNFMNGLGNWAVPAGEGGGSVKGTLTCKIFYGGGTVMSNGFYGLTSTGFWIATTWRVTDNMDATIDMNLVISCRERSNVTRPSGTYNIGATKTDKTEEFLTTNIANAVAWEANSDKKLYTWTIVLANADFDQGDLMYFFLVTDSNYDFDVFDISVEYTEAV